MQKWKKILLSLTILLLTSEVILRYAGMGEVMTYIKNEKYEYFPAPNQNVSRWGNQIKTNEVGMRSASLKGLKKKRVILKIGDSVLNGGSKCSNKELASSQLENELKKDDSSFQVLNVSAGSWGPDNAFNYIKENGHFNAEVIIAVFNSHDYNDHMHFKDVVGNYPSWPAVQPTFAVSDLISNYGWPKIKSWFGYNPYEYLEGVDDSGYNPGWNGIIDYCDKNDIELLIYLHPEVNEIKSKVYERRGKMLIDSLQTRNVNLILGLDYAPKLTNYIDNIHQNNKGQKHLAKVLYPFVKNLLN